MCVNSLEMNETNENNFKINIFKGVLNENILHSVQDLYTAYLVSVCFQVLNNLQISVELSKRSRSSTSTSATVKPTRRVLLRDRYPIDAMFLKCLLITIKVEI